MREHRPTVLCLLEPFCDVDRFDYFRIRFGFDSAYCGASD